MRAPEMKPVYALPAACCLLPAAVAPRHGITTPWRCIDIARKERPIPSSQPSDHLSREGAEEKRGGCRLNNGREQDREIPDASPPTAVIRRTKSLRVAVEKRIVGHAQQGIWLAWPGHGGDERR